MRMSCNGCRVLRKGCSDDCSIRPCLQWIKDPESQGNATVFLAKFYGRAGLMNLVNAGPEHLRPAIFRSLLYEACGRIVNPIYGSVGLLWSGRWQLCQDAVEAVLKGAPIVQIASDTEEPNNGPPLKAYDIRHVSKDENSGGSNVDLHRIRTRCRFKRSGSKGKAKPNRVNCEEELSGHDEVNNRSSSHESTLSHQSEPAHAAEGQSRETAEESLVSVETAEGSAAAAPTKVEHDESASMADNNVDVKLELTLGFGPVNRSRSRSPESFGKITESCHNSDDTVYRVDLGLGYPM